MKGRFTYCFLMLALLICPAGVNSQDTGKGYPAEKLIVMTDRTLYITGENILFSALIIQADGRPDHELSRILYAELVKPDGSRVAAGKYAVENYSAHGCLVIPEETLTGYYYLKSYTRWMRNGSVEGYSYRRLKIVNPYNTEMLTGSDIEVDSAAEADTETFRVSTDKTIYHLREEVELKIEKDTKQVIEGKLCLSVIPEMAFDGQETRDVSVDSLPAEIQYYPDTRGISLSGRFLEETNGNPVPNALVNLSVVGDYDVMAIRTDESGRFNFALPGYSGKRDIFLCGEDLTGMKTEIFIDNDFCSRVVKLPSPAFHLTENEKATALRMAVNQKIASVFYRNTLPGDTGLMQNNLPFYGKPDEILVMDKYIDLPTVEDYFSELLGSVNVRKFEGRKIFRFNSDRTEMTIYDPLVLIDWVAVNDIVKILAMSPRLIDRIELVNAPYVKGNITYGGIISFVSKNNDFAGIDLPTSGTFINYKFLENCSGVIYSGPLPENLPDARNTVYWDPDIKLNDDEGTVIRFTVPDTPGRYIAVLRGIINSAELTIDKLEFQVVGD